MKVSETQKLVDDARRGVAGKAPVLPAAPIVVATPITPPASPPTTNSDVPAVPTIALAKYRELEQMHAAVNIALRNEKDKAKKTELAASKSNSKAFVTNNEVAVLESEIKRLKAVPPTIVVEERIVEKVVVAERIVEKIVIKVVDRPVERAANGSGRLLAHRLVIPLTIRVEITPSAGTPPSVVEARLREAITKMAATVSVLQGAIATLRDENSKSPSPFNLVVHSNWSFDRSRHLFFLVASSTDDLAFQLRCCSRALVSEHGISIGFRFVVVADLRFSFFAIRSFSFCNLLCLFHPFD